MKKLQECIENKGANTSRNREIIYKILLQSDECLLIEDIQNRAKEMYGKKIVLNTLYRHLRFFIECELVFALQDNEKRAYYALCKEEPLLFTLCPKCNHIESLTNESYGMFQKGDVVTIARKCQKCL